MGDNLKFIRSITVLSDNGQYVESWSPWLEAFKPIDDKYKPTGYLLQFPVWIQAEHGVRIVLSSNSSLNGAVFDLREYSLSIFPCQRTIETKIQIQIRSHIGIGDNDNALIKVAFGDHFLSTPGGQQILSPTKPLKLVIQLTVDGVFEVFSSLNPFVPLFKTVFSADVQPSVFVPIKYIAFTSPSKSLAHFVYDVDEDVILKRPTQELLPLNIVQNPLLVSRDYPIGFSKLCKFEENFELLTNFIG